MFRSAFHVFRLLRSYKRFRHAGAAIFILASLSILAPNLTNTVINTARDTIEPAIVYAEHYIPQLSTYLHTSSSSARVSDVRSADFSDVSQTHLDAGIPSEVDQVLIRKGYAVGYQYSIKQPEWVSYHLIPDLVSITRKRHDSFREDTEIPSRYRAQLSDFRHSGYDRGHLAPRAAIDFTEESMAESFLLSNMSPQLPAFNRGIWKRLESQIRKLGSRHELYIVTGPYFDARKPLKYCHSIPVPDVFWKVVYDRTDDRMFAYFIPHNYALSRVPDPITVDQLEHILGFDFYNALPDEFENELESHL